MKKLISIGVALALVTLAVVPGIAAAQCDYDGVEPDTYAKIPFAIIETGLMLVGDIITALPSDMGIPAWIADVTDAMAPWAGGPLSWTVDMLGWGIALVGQILGVLGPLLGLPEDLDLVGLVNTIACQMFTPFECIVPGVPPFDPCG